MKYKILELFKNSDDYISGEHISTTLGVTRASIWKYIKALKEEGYKFTSSTKIGYKLLSRPDILNKAEVFPLLNTKYIGREYLHFQSTTSTNTLAKDFAKTKPINGAIFVSEEQTQGKGRLGKHWTSPKSSGIWFSLLLTPNIPTAEISKVTLIGAAAVYLALKEFNIESKIKWPNDIVINNKKICGILSEINGEINNINYLIMGIGLNVHMIDTDFPEEIKDKATSLTLEFGNTFNRKLLLSSILNNFEILYEDFLHTRTLNKTLEISRKSSILLGKTVQCIRGTTTILAKAKDITENGELLVELLDGTFEKIICGEVSVRGLYGYVD